MSNVDKITDEIVIAFSTTTTKTGMNFRNTRPYWVSGWRGKKIYYCDTSDGVDKLASNIAEIVPELAGYSQAIAYQVGKQLMEARNKQFMAAREEQAKEG